MEQEKNWYYLLPDGRKAENMLEAREMLGEKQGHRISYNYFRLLVRNGTVIKINQSINSGKLHSNAEEILLREQRRKVELRGQCQE